MTELQINKIVELGFGYCGQMAYGSKKNKDIFYNANILVGKKKVWFGDFPSHKKHKLQLLADITGQEVYLLREMDCRFETEKEPFLDNPIYHLVP